MLLTKTVKIKLNGNNVKHFEEKGYKISRRKDKWGSYSFKNGEEIEVKVEDLKDGSHAEIECLCDYCLENGVETVIKKEWKRYIKDNIKSVVHKDCCSSCQQIKTKECNIINFGVENKMYIDEYKNKIKETMIQKYGVKSPLQSEEIKQKTKNTLVERYGVDNPMKIKDVSEKAYNNAKNTFIEKYNVDNPMKLKETVDKQRETYYKNGTTPTSNQQRYLNTLLGGELNFPIDNCSVDIAFPEEKIYLEYNGGGHDLIVKLGGISKEEFDIKEIRRYKFLKSLGWKGIFIESKNDYLPGEESLLNEINIAKEWFKSNERGHFHYNIKVENKTKDRQYYDLRKIKEDDVYYFEEA